MQVSGRFHGIAEEFGALPHEIMPDATRFVYVIGGSAILILGLGIVSYTKKRSVFWAFTGLFSFIGFGIIAVLEDKNALPPHSK